MSQSLFLFRFALNGRKYSTNTVIVFFFFNFQLVFCFSQLQRLCVMCSISVLVSFYMNFFTTFAFIFSHYCQFSLCIVFVCYLFCSLFSSLLFSFGYISLSNILYFSYIFTACFTVSLKNSDQEP